jgi:hypothetical protein
MQPTKNFLFFMRKLGISVTIITGLVINLTAKIALANVGWQKRETTRIEWEKGKTMNCNGKGVEFLITGSNMHSTFYNLAVACLNLNRKNQADWVILGGVSWVYQNGRKDAFIHRFPPRTRNSGAQPNLYSFAKFVIGYNCRADNIEIVNFQSKWECEEYSSTIENNVLKTFGSQQLKENWPIKSTDYIPFKFSNLESSKHHTTNAQ